MVVLTMITSWAVKQNSATSQEMKATMSLKAQIINRIFTSKTISTEDQEMILLPAVAVDIMTSLMDSMTLHKSFMVDPEMMKFMEAMTNTSSTLPVALETIGSGLVIILGTNMISRAILMRIQYLLAETEESKEKKTPPTVKVLPPRMETMSLTLARTSSE
jgi:tetrahydromethanopterin S-methyltransferase subunit E